MNPPPDFNRLARIYRWIEFMSFGPWLMRCRCAFLDDCCSAQHGLALGDGDGRFTARLLHENHSIRIDAVDASTAMLNALVRQAGPHATRVRTHLADLRRWQPQSLAYDLIISHFSLDCLTTSEVQSLAAALARAVPPGSLWVVSEFAVPEDWYGWLVAQPTVSLLYRAFGWLTGLQIRKLPDHSTALRQAGFALQKHRIWLGGILISELWSAGRERK